MASLELPNLGDADGSDWMVIFSLCHIFVSITVAFVFFFLFCQQIIDSLLKTVVKQKACMLAVCLASKLVILSFHYLLASNARFTKKYILLWTLNSKCKSIRKIVFFFAWASKFDLNSIASCSRFVLADIVESGISFQKRVRVYL